MVWIRFLGLGIAFLAWLVLRFFHLAIYILKYSEIRLFFLLCVSARDKCRGRNVPNGQLPIQIKRGDNTVSALSSSLEPKAEGMALVQLTRFDSG